MNKLYFLFALCVFIMLYLLSSCTSAMISMEKPPAKEYEGEKPMFLVDRHQAFGMECGSCHHEDPPSKLVSTDVCVGCHSEYTPSERPPVTDFMNPHNSHATFSDCSECHNAHKPSVDFCSTCHGNMGFDIP